MAKPRREDHKQFVRGEKIYTAGQTAEKVYILQTGLVSLTYTRGGRSLEITQAAAHSLIGEEALRGDPTYGFTATAINPTSVIEIPAAAARALLEGADPEVRTFAHALEAKERNLILELTKLKLEDDLTPCPPDLLGKLFSTIHLVVSYTGSDKKGARVVNWTSFKRYCQRVFLESPVRLEQAIYLLARIGAAKLEMVKNDTDPEGPEVLGFVHFYHLDRLASFFDFFQKRIGPEAEWSFSADDQDTAKALGDFFKTIETQRKQEQAEEEELSDSVQARLDDVPQVIQNPESSGIHFDFSIEGHHAVFSFEALAQIATHWSLLSEIDQWIKNGRVEGSPAPDNSVPKAKPIGQRRAG